MEYLVEMKNMTMKFPGVIALNNVSFALKPGEVHVLLGENGAGKSTLVKMLSGINRPTQGEIIIGGKSYAYLTPKKSAENKIALIYQELSVINELSIAENLYVGKLPHKKVAGISLVDYKTINENAKKYMDAIGLKRNPSTLVQDISISEKQQVEIAKALASEAKIIVMDEPTSSLSIEETEELFRIIRTLILLYYTCFFNSFNELLSPTAAPWPPRFAKVLQRYCLSLLHSKFFSMFF